MPLIANNKAIRQLTNGFIYISIEIIYLMLTLLKDIPCSTWQY